MNKLLLPILLSGSVIFTTLESNTAAFQYRYEIRGASWSLEDQKKLYCYKELMIETYENLVFDYETRYYESIIQDNLQKFFYEDVSIVSYNNGVLYLVIGEGKGTTIKGKFRNDRCDNETIQEKYYIFEFFK